MRPFTQTRRLLSRLKSTLTGRRQKPVSEPSSKEDIVSIPLDVVRAYHRRTKHAPGRSARALGYMDWDTQPDPFRRYLSAPHIPLDQMPVTPEPRFEAVSLEGYVSPHSLDRAFVSQLLFDSLSLSAWKVAGETRWALRVNPSSGNLHPTEGYLVAAAIPGLTKNAGVYHYAPKAHGLEARFSLSDDQVHRLMVGLPEGSVVVGLTSIHWRESWKYGERAYRYCQHDVGHAIGAVSIAAAGLGWTARVLMGAGDLAVAQLLGVESQRGPEAEHPDLLICLSPGAAEAGDLAGWRLSEQLLTEISAGQWMGVPNQLSKEHHPWPVIDQVSTAAEAPPFKGGSFTRDANGIVTVGESPISLRQVIRQRRSAVAMDGQGGITASAFFHMMAKCMPGKGQVPQSTLPWRPRVHLVVFVHRVQGLAPGLYLLIRDNEARADLEAALDDSFQWTRPEGCPDGLPLVCLSLGNERAHARSISCGQAIASDGAFALGMLAEFDSTLTNLGPWFYRHLHWEAGLIGQVLYLEAEASGVRATGIGCFFDDEMHRRLGLRDTSFQTIYHFTVGVPVDDSRLLTEPAYGHLNDSE